MFNTTKIGMCGTIGAVIVGLAAVAGTTGRADAQLVQTINYLNFNDTSAMTLNGVATQSAGAGSEQMTLSLTPPTRASAGSAYFSTAQRVDLGFVTDFRFRVRDRSGTGSDGLTFIVQNQGLGALGGSGGAIGFGTNLAFPVSPTNTGILNSLAVVFDLWDNSANWPTVPGANVITVQNSHLGSGSANTPSSIDSLGGVAVSGAFNDGATHTVRIAYTPGVMQIYYDNLATPTLSVPVNLSSALSLTNGQTAFVGFTAATGALVNVERHEIRDWQFSSVVPAPGAMALLGLGGAIAARRRRTR
jgi:MYXO-CTERM domain-containing protein